MKFIISLFTSLFILFLSANAQENNKASKPTIITKAKSMVHVTSIASRINELPPPITKEEEMMDGRASKNQVIPGKGSSGEDQLFKNKSKLEGKLKGKTPDLVFEGAQSNSMPTDPSLALGPDHIFVVYNTGFQIFDKDGISLAGPFAPNPSIFPNSGCCDLTVSYDNEADRWVVSFLGAGAQIAVSDGPDPVNDGWNVYTISEINDYQKLSVWSDGYYMTENTGGTNNIWALEREAMLIGDVDAQVIGFSLPELVTSGFYSPQAFNVSTADLPAAGSVPIVYLQDDAWSGVSQDHIKMWFVDADWVSPELSTISDPEVFDVTDFVSVFDGGSFVNLPQPNGGTTIDALQATIMNQAQFRKYSGHNSAVFNFVVDVDPTTSGKLAAIRWYEFRQDADGEPWSMYQEGTYTSPDGKHAWHASLIMDFAGNIGMGYSAMDGDSSTTLGSYYTGRYSNDELGSMSIGEETILVGTANIPGTRYGDYSKIDIDPADDKRFYFINEMMNNGRKDIVGRFQIAPNFTNDLGVVNIDAPVDGALTTEDSIKVSIFNYGESEAFGFSVAYQIDGGAAVEQAFLDTIASTETVQFTFTVPADLSIVGNTYSITSYTIYDIDEYFDNDTSTQEVTHLHPNDVGVSAFSSPSSGSGLTNAEDVSITITNYGSSTQTSIPVFYILDGGDPQTATYTGSIEQEQSDSFTFSVAIDLSELGDHVIVSGTELVDDAITENDEIMKVVSNFICQPTSNCSGYGDGVTEIQWADQDLIVNCGTTGYTDDTDIIFNFALEDNPFEGTVQTGYSDDYYAIWIDFNDNNSFESDELVANGNMPNADVDTPFSVDFSDFPNLTTGMHLMRVRGDDPASGDLLEPCDNLTWGNTNDYTANITGDFSVGIEENGFAQADLLINYLPGNQIEVVFNTTNYTERLPITVYNTLGQNLAYYTVEHNGNGYVKTIDMSYVTPGVYFIKVGNEELNKVKRVFVK